VSSAGGEVSVLVLKRKEGQWLEITHRSGDRMRIRVGRIEAGHPGSLNLVFDGDPGDFAIERDERRKRPASPRSEITDRHYEIARKVAEKFARSRPHLADDYLSATYYALAKLSARQPEGDIWPDAYVYLAAVGEAGKVDRRGNARRRSGRTLHIDAALAATLLCRFSPESPVDFDDLCKSLREPDATVIRLCFGEGLSQTEAGNALGKSQPFVNRCYHRGLDRLRERLQA
jgi:RNA polymerase sigma factor (sigma-70 family)